jgi:hypothetical protein
VNRAEFRATVDRLAWTAGETATAEILLAADEYAASLVEECARTPQYLRDQSLSRARAEVAGQIASSLEALAAVPGASQSERARIAQALEDAATARRIGGICARPEQEAS